MPTRRANDDILRGKAADDLAKYRASVAGDPDDRGYERLVANVGKAMQTQRNAGWVTDVSKMSHILNRLVDRIIDHKDSIDGKKSRSARTFNMSLINTAYTVLADGTKFRYFDAVDRGRKPVRAKAGGKLMFITNMPNDNVRDLDIDGVARIIGTNWVRGTTPQYITAKSVGESKVAIPLAIEKQLREFASDMQNYADSYGPSVPRDLGFVSGGKYTIDQYEIVGTASSRNKDELYRVKRSRAKEREKRAERKKFGYNIDNQATRKRDKGEKSTNFRESEALKAAGLVARGRYEYKTWTYTVIPKVVIRFLDEIEEPGQIDDDILDDLAEERFQQGIDDYEVAAERLAERNFSAVRATREEYEKELLAEAYDYSRERIKLIQQLNAESKKTEGTIQNLHAKVKADFAQNSLAGFSAAQQLSGFLRDLAYGASKYGGQILEVEGQDPRGPGYRDRPAENDRRTINQARGAVLTALTQYTNATQIVRYFMKAVRPTMEIFKKNTKSRSGYKLMSDGSVLAPSAPDNLRNKYEFVATGRLAKLLKEYTSS
jgi:hypothetical protein